MCSHKRDEEETQVLNCNSLDTDQESERTWTESVVRDRRLDRICPHKGNWVE